MGDLISRQDAIKNAHFPVIDDAGYEVVRVDDILALPSTEPKTECIVQIKIDRDDIEDFVNEKVNEIVEKMKEPKTGRWTWDDKGYFYCGRCGKKTDDQTRTTNYCPNCGSYNGG